MPVDKLRAPSDIKRLEDVLIYSRYRLFRLRIIRPFTIAILEFYMNRASYPPGPSLKTKKALIILDIQNDLFSDSNKLPLIENYDFVVGLKELIPYLRKNTIIVWTHRHIKGAKLYQEITEWANSHRELRDMVDVTKDFLLIKVHSSAFEQTDLLMTLRGRMIIDVLLADWSTDESIYLTAQSAAPHRFRLFVIENCLEYRNKEERAKVVDQMVEILSVETVCNKWFMKDDKGLSMQLNGLRLNVNKHKF